MSLDRWAALSTSSTLWTACGSIHQAVVTSNHPKSCICSSCNAKKGAHGARGVHTTAASQAPGGAIHPAMDASNHPHSCACTNCMIKKRALGARGLHTAAASQAASGTIQQAMVTRNHPHSCECTNCMIKGGAKGLHSTATSHRNSSPKVVRRADMPAQWPYAGDKKEDNRKYQEQMREYKAKVAILRNAWRPLVDQHRDELIRRKEERDQIRLAAQEEDLARQYDRWKVPTELRTSQQIRSDPEAREYSYARHALRNSLAQVSRVAQTELLLRESGHWVDPQNLDEAIEHALDNPTDLFQGGEPWDGTLNRIPEYVEGFEGPHVEAAKPDFQKRDRKKQKKDEKEKKPVPRPVW